jgi:nitrogen-specific signal transduction histidine kinase/CheY-like chemotaxis protein
MDIDPRIQAESVKASLEAQLRESQKMEAIGTLAGGIAHDFNNILAVILGNAELARHFRSETNPQTFHCIEEIYKAGMRARDLVRQLLAFCRRQPTDRKSISLTPIIEDSIRLLRSTMPARVDLLFTSSPEVPHVLADFTQIQQVVINLATNAVQAMNGKPGSIRIHLDTLERHSDSANAIPNWHIAQLESAHWQNCDNIVRLTIIDDGPGMDVAVLERIFEPFFTTKPVDEGTGLGLAVVHGIVRAHDGEITVDSHPGKGATFTIYFPEARTIQFESTQGNPLEPNDLERLSTPAALAASTASVCTILYLDDDEMVLKSLVSLLGLYGFQVRGYSDQLTALNALRIAENHFDILVTDYNMRGLSGLDVAKQVRKIRPDLPIIVISGHIDHELHTNADAAGVRALIAKPFTAEYFRDVVQQLLHPNETIKTKQR